MGFWEQNGGGVMLTINELVYTFEVLKSVLILVIIDQEM